MIITYENLPEVRAAHPQDHIVFAGGVFDLIHEGHVAALERRRKFGSLLAVGVVSDERESGSAKARTDPFVMKPVD